MPVFARKRSDKKTDKGGLDSLLNEVWVFLELNPSLETLTSLNKEVRPFFPSDNGIWSYPSVSSLSDHSTWRC